MNGKLLSLMALALLFAATQISAQDKIAITVKGSELNNGVVIVEVVKAGKTYEMQCNRGVPSCTLLKSGKYQMVELPANSGMYDCKDVQVYPDAADTSEAEKKIGEYCLVEK